MKEGEGAKKSKNCKRGREKFDTSSESDPIVVKSCESASSPDILNTSLPFSSISSSGPCMINFNSEITESVSVSVHLRCFKGGGSEIPFSSMSLLPLPLISEEIIQVEFSLIQVMVSILPISSLLVVL